MSLLLRESAFADYRCDRPTSLGMHVESRCKIPKMCGPSDSWTFDDRTVLAASFSKARLAVTKGAQWEAALLDDRCLGVVIDVEGDWDLPRGDPQDHG